MGGTGGPNWGWSQRNSHLGSFVRSIIFTKESEGLQPAAILPPLYCKSFPSARKSSKVPFGDAAGEW